MLLTKLLGKVSVIRRYSSPCQNCLRHVLPNQKANFVKRYFSSTPRKHLIYKLSSRGLVKVKGPDAVPFLQGLITSDVELLGQESKCQYSMLLNVQGRVLYDLILYDITSSSDESTILVECDRALADKFVSDIKKYKIRKKVSLDDVSDTNVVLATLQGDSHPLPWKHEVVMETADPRVPAFGTRIIAPADTLAGTDACIDETGYHEMRLKWGIPEGPQDLPPGNCFPLESNLVFMNGVSFSKGCYLGQELTARTHHTGVTRKRLMPLIFHSSPVNVEAGETVQNENKKNVGKYRTSNGQYGLGLMRTANVGGQLSVKSKTGEMLSLRAEIPTWWPQQS